MEEEKTGEGETSRKQNRQPEGSRARERGGGRRPAEDSELDKAGVAETFGRYDAPVQNDKGDDEETEMEGVRDTGQRVRVSIKARRIRVDAREKRVEYIQRLEDVMEDCDSIISDPEGYEELQIKAMAILIRAVKVCYGLVTDEQVETLEEELEDLKRRVRERLQKPEETA